MKKIYKSKNVGMTISNRDIQVVGERLSTLIKQNGGGISPSLVVEDARPTNSPLHKFFEK
jgi:hypothetical protein